MTDKTKNILGVLLWIIIVVPILSFIFFGIYQEKGIFPFLYMGGALIFISLIVLANHLYSAGKPTNYLGMDDEDL